MSLPAGVARTAPSAGGAAVPPSTTELLDAVDQPVIAVDLARVITYWNRAAERTFGWTAAEAVGRISTEVISRVETPEQARQIVEVLRRGESWSGDYEITRRDGSRVSVYVTNKPVFDGDHRLIAIIAVSVDTTESKAGERARRQLAAIVDGTADAIYSSSPDGTITSWNAAAEQLFGYTAAEAVGETVALLVPPELAVEHLERRARLNAGGPHERVEARRRRKDGSIVDVLITMSTITDENGDIVGQSVIAHDITQATNAHRALEASEHRLADAQRTAQLGSFEVDVATRELTWSAEYYRILGLHPLLMPSAALFSSCVHPDDVVDVGLAWTEGTRRGIAFDIEFRIVRPDATTRWVRARGRPEIDADGAVVKVSGTLTDETDRVDADRLRRAAETQFEIGFEQSAIATAIADLAGIPIRVNAAMCTVLGRPEHELVGRRWTEYTYPDDVSLGQLVLERFAAGDDGYADERRYLRPDGTVVWAATNVALVRDEHNEPQYIFFQAQDITERKRAQSALRESEEQLRFAMAHAPVGMALRDLDGRWLEVNEALCALIGRTEDELRALTVDDIVHPDDLAMDRDAVVRLLAGEREVFHVDKRYIHADGHAVDVLASMAIARDGDGVPTHLIVQVQDITERKRVEIERDGYLEDLRRSNAELEQFAYVASHDLSEPLRAISGPVSLLGRRYRGTLDEEADQFIDFAVDGCLRMQTLIDDLLAYSRVGRTPTPAGPVDCNAVMASVLDGLRDQIDTANAVIDVEPLPTVWGDAGQIGQVLQNLVSNAIKFAAPDRPPTVAVSAREVGGDWRFDVVDNGIGIEERHRERVFGMFKRLHGRDTYAGTGIGLAIVKKLVEQRGGRVGVDDGPDGRGTCVWFTIPRREVVLT